MWGRRKPRDEQQDEAPRPLREALRAARIEAAERTGVVVELRDAEMARLEILDDELDPVFAEVPSHIALFDRGISRGEVPRLWIDAVAHVEMGRDKRVYRFVQDSRFGRKVLAESILSSEIARGHEIHRPPHDRTRAHAGGRGACGDGGRGAAPARPDVGVHRRHRVRDHRALGARLARRAVVQATVGTLSPGPYLTVRDVDTSLR
jgi:hypothetical protein